MSIHTQSAIDLAAKNANGHTITSGHSTSEGSNAGRDVSLLREVKPALIASSISQQDLIDGANAFLASIVQDSDDAIISKGLDGIIMSWNAGAERLFGYSAEEAVGRSITMLIPADRLDEEPRIIECLKRGERVDHFETKRRHKDGTLLDISLTISPVRDSQGRIIGASKVARDITDRTRAEQALKINEQRIRRQNEAFQAAITGAPLEESLAILARIVADTDPEARFGFHTADVDGTCLHPIRIAGGVPGSYMDAVDNFPIGVDSLGCGLALATGEIVITPDVFEDARWKKNYALDLAKAHGFRACWSFPIATLDTLPVGTFYRYFTDRREPTPDDLAATEMVTQAAAIIISRHSQAQQRAQVERALRESETRYGALFETIDEGFCIIEFFDGPHGPLSDYVHVEANPAYERHAGIPNIVGQKLREMVPDEADGWAELYRHVLVTGEPIRFQRELVATKRHLELSAFRVEPESRRQVAVLFQDITSRKQAEEALQRHQEMLEDLVKKRTDEVKLAERSLATSERMAAVGTLASGLAHDMANVLLPLGIRLDTLVTHASVDGATHDHLTAVQGLVAHLREMSRNLSLFSRDPEKEGIVGQTDLTDWSSRAWHFIEKSLRTPGDGSASIEIVCEIPKGLPKLNIAPHRFTQLIQNLLHNARDAVLARRALPGAGGDTNYRGRIVLTARNGKGIVLTISDDGTGMDEETMRRCTEPFFTTRNRPDALGGAGSGMGLALVHSIVERCGGSMDIQSSTQPPHQGTIITMRFPAKTA